MPSAALPGAALRVMRTAAGWRALRLALLVGGLFLLGVVCGERAQAAEGVPSVPEAVGRMPAIVPVELAQASPAVEVPPAGPAVRDVLRPVTGHVVRTVTDVVVRPVGDVVAAVTEELGAAVPAEVPPLEALPQPSPSLPPVPSSPPLSTLPDVSGLPDGPDLPEPPVRLIPGDQEPDPATAPPTTPDADADADAGVTEADGADARDASDGPADAAIVTVAYGPGLDGDDGTRFTAHDDARDVTSGPTVHSPAHQAPTGGADGALGAGAGADGGAPRHGDAHAIAPHHQVPVRLVPGAVAHADVPEPRERYRDIPVSPA
ncbi:hypothetical protein [Streptomyces flaveolus]|uniref:hypothetical protein n=1 Tax=Streptomyces flaveolus TaxID=67297 RepID=UPI00167067DB|nr:hypothetical protein [Streptomyces flaveolus]GGQ53562.1 hypothetical protein GCM10010216_13370 [Streptomyces flaveolus]